ncbi:hypothetical protein R3P38DRAFT_2809309 [Favolaschia claudopus]|uniref:Uncharacterized protein n=1 Tax=Favolaschia claudopus TaxID=2862362 RepID=A0AAV9ZEM0_9AGAR
MYSNQLQSAGWAAARIQHFRFQSSIMRRLDVKQRNVFEIKTVRIVASKSGSWDRFDERTHKQCQKLAGRRTLQCGVQRTGNPPKNENLPRHQTRLELGEPSLACGAAHRFIHFMGPPTPIPSSHGGPHVQEWASPAIAWGRPQFTPFYGATHSCHPSRMGAPMFRINYSLGPPMIYSDPGRAQFSHEIMGAPSPLRTTFMGSPNRRSHEIMGPPTRTRSTCHGRAIPSS